MLFNNIVDEDIVNVLTHISLFCKQIGSVDTQVSSEAVYQTCLKMRSHFPTREDSTEENSIEKASIFKRAAVFVACFMELMPIQPNAFLNSKLPSEVKKYNSNSIIALDIALFYMVDAIIERSDGEKFTLSKGFIISTHSYYDILDMLSNEVCLQHHFKSISLLFEQIAYKTHPEAQYDQPVLCKVPSLPPPVYRSQYKRLSDTPESVPDWDDLTDFWGVLN